LIFVKALGQTGHQNAEQGVLFSFEKENQMKFSQKSAFFVALSISLSVAAWAQGPGPGSGMGGMRMGPDNTSGWRMMSRAERNEHHKMMQSMKTHDECMAYMDKHHAQMMDRAKEKGRPMPAKPRQDGCAWLKK
jgi:hypothetical protein